MLIGLISDTHIARSEERLPPQIKTAFSGVDLILHAGDIWIPSVLEELDAIAPVKAAWGDDDLENDLGNDPRMTKEKVHELNGTTLWLMHEKPAYGLIVPRENRLTFNNSEKNWKIPHVVIYGHTHQPGIEHHKGVLIVNPGSATWPHYVPQPGTVGLLTIQEGSVDARIISLK